ncbi:uncharacterized protein LOC110188621 [Drosophila serrata]|uniref:uncharacterized protein LOC110188621 n=1 Tax=Drosophila serrata TaxID=7274 RepID=UPI000A1CFBE0|nr:uncharacterized protein LOC110188621 [Drosophila serrata]
MTPGESFDYVQPLISFPELTVPQVQRITDVREFMSSPENYNGDIEDLKERLGAKFQQCKDLLKILGDRLQLKIDELKEVREEMIVLSVEMEKPTAALRFVTNHEKIKLNCLGESEDKEYEISDALGWFNVKLSRANCEILSLKSDLDYINYLLSISQLNIKTVIKFYNVSNQFEEEHTI